MYCILPGNLPIESLLPIKLMLYSLYLSQCIDREVGKQLKKKQPEIKQTADHIAERVTNVCQYLYGSNSIACDICHPFELCTHGPWNFHNNLIELLLFPHC